MAYDFSKEKRKVIFEVERSSGDKVQGTHITREDSSDSWFDLRIVYQPKDSDEWRPTQKGVRVGADNMVELVKSIMRNVLSADEINDIIEYGEDMLDEMQEMQGDPEIN